MSIAARLQQVGTCPLSDVMGANQAALGLYALVPGARMAGPAFTAKAPPGSVPTLLKALELAPPGSVLAVDGEGCADAALFGGLFARYAARRGLAGFAVDGASRDTADLAALGFPAFARAVCPRAWVNPAMGEIGVPVTLGGTAVRPGDWLVGDADGIVVIPRERLEEVLAAGEAKVHREAEIARRIDAGEALADIVNMRAQLGL